MADNLLVSPVAATWQVSAKSLNGGDVFILDVGYRLYQWNGSGANQMEKAKASQVAIGIKDERVHLDTLKDADGNTVDAVEIVRLDQGDKSEDLPDFWKLLGGDKSMVGAAKEDSAEDDKAHSQQTVLYQLHEDDATGKLTKSKCKGCYRSELDETDTFILVCPGEIFAWIGKRATDSERKNAMVKAQNFIPEMNMPVWTPVTRVVQGAEPQLFKSKFPDWQSASMDKPTPENVMLGKVSAFCLLPAACCLLPAARCPLPAAPPHAYTRIRIHTPLLTHSSGHLERLKYRQGREGGFGRADLQKVHGLYAEGAQEAPRAAQQGPAAYPSGREALGAG